MRGLLLAAGRGSRLKDLTAEKPKCMVELKGKPLLQWQLEALRGADINDIAVVRGYCKDVIAFTGATYFENPRWQETNMVMSLMAADPWLKLGETLVSYTDIVYPKETIETLMQAQGDIVISYNTRWLPLWAARCANPLDDAETFKFDASGRLVEIGQKAKTVEEIEGQYMGLHKFTPVGWEKIARWIKAQPVERQNKLDMTALLNGLLQSGIEIQTVPVAGKWGEVDNQDDLELYHARWNEFLF